MPHSSLKGRLLVATPALRHPDFDRTVVLVLEHRHEGALGLVLNRPSEVGLDDAVPDWEPFAARPPVVFIGGPVAPAAAICLARSDAGDNGEAWSPVLGSLGVLDEVRLFAGYAGWGPEQLEGEVAAGAWFVVDAQPDDALSAHPHELWSQVLRRHGGRLAAFASFPADPSRN
jgi:putative transcriptional regulator